MRKLITLGLAALVLAGCAQRSPEERNQRRLDDLAQYFPKAEDRQGLYSAWGIESFGYISTLEINYFPDDVSDDAVMERTARYCGQFKGYGARDRAWRRHPPKDHEIDTVGGFGRRVVRNVWLTCVPQD